MMSRHPVHIIRVVTSVKLKMHLLNRENEQAKHGYAVVESKKGNDLFEVGKLDTVVFVVCVRTKLGAPPFLCLGAVSAFKPLSGLVH